MIRTSRLALAIIPILLGAAACRAQTQATFQTKDLELKVDQAGRVCGLVDRRVGSDYLAADQDRPLLQLRVGGTFTPPSEMVWHADASRMQLTFAPAGITAAISVTPKPTSVVFELKAVTPADKADALQWGPIPTTIKQTVGNVVGVVRNDRFAIGIQGLNVKTLGGPLPNDEGVESSRGRTAIATPWGSRLQAYTLDRSRPRKITVWGGHFRNMPVPPIPGETLVGSKIALFGCPANEALNRIGQIEQAEGLPRPIFDGTWVKQAREAGRPYLIAGFGERNIDEMLAFTKRANLASLYHPGPFTTWGHYELNRGHFPNGTKGMKQCVAKADKLGIRLGVHTLTNFINTNDPYVTPVPDKRLAKTGSTALAADIDAEATVMPVASTEYVDNDKANWLRTVMIGQELIRYGKVTRGQPPTLTQCQRGAFGTKASTHVSGAEVAKLLDHPYKVFFPNYEMQHEIAIRLAKLFNETGLMHLDFDGHEGCWASGQGDFAVNMFAKVFWDHLDRPVYNGSSIIRPFYWRINTAVNWGEPWYGGFRSSMSQYRFNNQPLLRRNYMPGMLGWFSMQPHTTLADIEWMLARCAGYDAGFALATNHSTLKHNPQTGAILDAIREWDAARQARAFSDVQRAALRNPDNEYHLEPAGPTRWKLYPYHQTKPYVYERRVLQPGQPTDVVWQVTNPDGAQPLRFRMSVDGERGSVANPTLEIDRRATVRVPVEIKPGQTLVCDEPNLTRLYDDKGRQIKAIPVPQPTPEIARGKYEVNMSADFSGEPAPKVTVRFKTRGTAELIEAK